MTNFETILRKHVLLRERMYSANPTEANQDRLHDAMRLLRAYEKENPPEEPEDFLKKFFTDPILQIYKLQMSIHKNEGEKEDESGI